MRAVVLVGGEGTRLRPLTQVTPKQMLPVANLPMIERVIEQLARHGIDEVVLSLGYKPEVFVEDFNEHKWRNVKISFAIEPPTLLDTAGALAFAARSDDIDETFVAVNGDILTDIDISALIDLHKKREAQATIALTPVEDPSAFGVVPTDDNGRVTAFIEKPPREEAPTNMINAGIYVIEPSVLDRIPLGERVSVERKIFPELAEDGSLYALGSDAYWLDTGTPEKYINANLDYVRGRRSDVAWPEVKHQDSNWIGANVTLSGQVSGSLMGSNCVIASGACVEECVLGPDIRVESGAVLRKSVLLAGSVVEENAEVEDSIVGENAKVHSGAQLRDFSITV